MGNYAGSKNNKYTKTQFGFLKKYHKLPRQELTNMFNDKFNLNISKKAIAGVCKRKGWLRDKEHWHYQKGNIPQNKGTKGLMKANCTSFKQGNISHNKRAIGSERVTKDGYIEIKVGEPNKWKLKHIYLWEYKNGKLPPKHCLVFLDHNKQNCAIDNLRLVHKFENLIFNRKKYANYNKSLTPMLRNIAALEYQIRKRKRKENKDEKN